MSAYWKIPLQGLVLIIGVLMFVFYVFNPSPMLFNRVHEREIADGPRALEYRALERQFEDTVVSNFVREYASGRTPIPCVHCNGDLKFATLDDRARAFGAGAVATGHYARVTRDERSGRYQLVRGVDPAKDQAYFLFSLTQEQLARAVFPVGDLAKDDVRAYARARRLPVADKPDSQEICFVPDDDYAAFVDKRTPSSSHQGEVVPQIWTYEHTLPGGQPARAFVWMQGHFYKNFTDPKIEPMILRAIAWAGKKPVGELIDYKAPARGGRRP